MNCRMNRCIKVGTVSSMVSDLIRLVIYISAIALTLTALPAKAAEPARPSTSDGFPPLDSQLEQLHYFEGQWTCSAVGIVVPFYAKKDSFTWTVKRVLNNFWFLGQEQNKQIATTQDTLGFNTLTKRFGRTILTNRGEFINMLSDGWVKQTWIWEGSKIQGIRRYAIREMIEKTNDGKFVTTYFTLNADLKGWEPQGNKICKKSS